MSKKDIKLSKLSKIVSEMADDIKIEGLDKAFFEAFEMNIEQLIHTRVNEKICIVHIKNTKRILWKYQL